MKTFLEWTDNKNENICPKCGSDDVGYPKCCTKLKTCVNCKHMWVIDRVEEGRFSCCKKALKEAGF